MGFPMDFDGIWWDLGGVLMYLVGFRWGSNGFYWDFGGVLMGFGGILGF